MLYGVHEIPASSEEDKDIDCLGSRIVDAARRTPDCNLIARGYVCFPGGGYTDTASPTSLGVMTLFV